MCIRDRPTAEINRLRIELLRLGYRVEDAEIRRGISPRTRHPLPAQGVVGKVGVHQSVPEPACAMQPMLAHVFGQPAGHDHAHPVVHVAGGPQLAHTGIHDGHAGAALLPRLQL